VHQLGVRGDDRHVPLRVEEQQRGGYRPWLPPSGPGRGPCIAGIPTELAQRTADVDQLRFRFHHEACRVRRTDGEDIDPPGGAACPQLYFEGHVPALASQAPGGVGHQPGVHHVPGLPWLRQCRGQQRWLEPAAERVDERHDDAQAKLVAAPGLEPPDRGLRHGGSLREITLGPAQPGPGVEDGTTNDVGRGGRPTSNRTNGHAPGIREGALLRLISRPARAG